MKRATCNRALNNTDVDVDVDVDIDVANGLLAGDAIRRLCLLDRSELVIQMNEAFLASRDGLRPLPQILLLLLLACQSTRPLTSVLQSVFGVRSLVLTYPLSSPISHVTSNER
jgi:hypothetical protein